LVRNIQRDSATERLKATPEKVLPDFHKRISQCVKGDILTNENFATVIKKKAAYLAAFS
jgi:hypothetical protein